MKRVVVALTAVASAFVSQAVVAQSRAVNIANITGSMLRKATKCGFPTDEFSREAGRAIDRYALNNKDKSEAIQQFVVSSTMSARTGPVGESCSEFRPAYLESLRDLKSTR